MDTQTNSEQKYYCSKCGGEIKVIEYPNLYRYLLKKLSEEPKPGTFNKSSISPLTPAFVNGFCYNLRLYTKCVVMTAVDCQDVAKKYPEKVGEELYQLADYIRNHSEGSMLDDSRGTFTLYDSLKSNSVYLFDYDENYENNILSYVFIFPANSSNELLFNGNNPIITKPYGK